jgi:hypothetical protein
MSLLVEAKRVLIRFNDMSVVAGKVLSDVGNGIYIKIEQNTHFKNGAILYIPMSSIVYIDVQN